MAACRIILPKLIWRYLVKRSRALRGRNLRRDNRVDGAPKVHQAPGGESHRGSFIDAIGHRSHASENPPTCIKPQEERSSRLSEKIGDLCKPGFCLAVLRKHTAGFLLQADATKCGQKISK